jgi:hypothetical protein
MVTMKSTVWWVVTPCYSSNLNMKETFLCDVGVSPNYTVLQPRRSYCFACELFIQLRNGQKT